MEHAQPASVIHEKSKFHTFVQLAMILAVITGVEIIVIFLPFSYAALFTTLAILSAVKFLAVIFWFMHLIYDRALCTIIFFIGMVLAAGTMAALLAVFRTDRSEAAAVPLETMSMIASSTGTERV
ncbi:MAG: cytochrome C oxidase subunit IV family protein [Opitutaceae bacterium]